MIVKVSGSPSASVAVRAIARAVSSVVGCAAVVGTGAWLTAVGGSAGGRGGTCGTGGGGGGVSGETGALRSPSGAAKTPAGLSPIARAIIQAIIEIPFASARWRATSAGLRTKPSRPLMRALVNSSSRSGFCELPGTPSGPSTSGRNVKLTPSGPPAASRRTVLGSSISFGVERAACGASKTNLNVTPLFAWTSLSRSSVLRACHSIRPPSAGRRPMTVPTAPPFAAPPATWRNRSRQPWSSISAWAASIGVWPSSVVYRRERKPALSFSSPSKKRPSRARVLSTWPKS
ncbi:MAG: hypothetical protein AVDCRST_MAG85-3409 [uncultured Solirubrobacteraceae bacterium]|uniref:Uncharacterized protein n=1 Tax=uncultured Solirubrobacteraceae bacterium TaxID=1162706 RepID=A0A6J4TMR1_9ACTN|nr:MAG: hypothetical protein AVDCRST_MAG85-3409 [uncultured Solirubrobacteraceae bacterium]